jgi:hypothetical protein
MFIAEDFIKEFDYKAKPANSKDWVEHAESMKIHTRGTYPKKLIEQVFPNEQQESIDFRKANYRAITKGPVNRAISRLHSFFHDANYTYNISKELAEYLDTKKFAVSERENLDFWMYLDKMVIRRMIEDPNGLLVWLPSGEGLTDETVKVEVKPELIDSDKIHTLTAEAVCYLTDEKSIVSVNGENKAEGKVYFLLTETEFYRIEQYGLKSDYKFQLLPVYKHNFGEVPVIVLGGEEMEGYFESYFALYLPFADEAIVQFSQHQASMVKCGFPLVEEAYMDCDSCTNGLVYDAAENCQKQCTKCGGTHKLVLRSPLGTYQRKAQAGIGDEILDTTPMVRFLAPDTAILSIQREAYKDYIQEGEKALSLVFAQEAQSGVAKEWDHQEEFSTLSKISNNFFDNIFYNSLWYCEKYRNITKPEVPVVYKPTDFKIETESDLLGKLKSLSESNAPQVFKVEAFKALSRKSFSNSEKIQRMIDITSMYDVLFGMTEDEITTMLASGTVTPEMHIKHLVAYKAVSLAAEKLGDKFIESAYDTIAKEMDAIIGLYIPKTATIIPLQDNQAAA